MSYTNWTTWWVEGTGWVGDVWQPTNFKIETASRHAAQALWVDYNERGFLVGHGASEVAFVALTTPPAVFAAREETNRSFEIVEVPAGSLLKVIAGAGVHGRFWRIKPDDTRAKPQIMQPNSIIVVGTFAADARFEFPHDAGQLQHVVI